MGSFASGFLLFGIALVFGATHSFELSKIAAFANTPEAMQPMFTIGALLMVFAMLFKVAAVPFHFWSPDVYEGSPTLVTAFMSTIVKVAFFAGFYKLMSVGFIGIHGFTDDILLIITGVTLIFGNLVALSQQNFKRLLAYSGISHAGYMLLVILSVQSQPAAALFFYGAVYALATIGAFAVAIPVFENTKREDITSFNGLGKTHPWVAGMLTLSMLSLAGIPPLAGFLGKYYVFSEAIRNGFVAIVIIAVLTSIVGVYYYFKVILAMYVKPAEETRPSKFPRTYALVLLVCVGLSLWLGVWPAWLLGLL
jgi:NADH-quinone oxidoreductase subunit N